MNQEQIKRLQAEEIANILTLATVWVLGGRMGDGGVTYLAAAASICALVGIAASGSFADSLGKLLRGRRNKGQTRNLPGARRSALRFQAALGLLGTLAALLAAGVAAEGILRIRYCMFPIMALAPVILLRTLSGVLQGYFQGEAAELPRAVSAILRVFFTAGFGFLFSGILGSYGEKAGNLLRDANYRPMYSCLGVALALCLAEGFVLLFLAVLFKGSRRRERGLRQEGAYPAGSFARDCIFHLCAGRWPQFLTGMLKLLPLPLGLALFARRTAKAPDTLFQYDLYVGGYLAVCGIFVFLVSALVLPALGKMFQHFRREEGRLARVAFQSGIHICLAHGIFLSGYVAAMGTQIAALLDKTNRGTVEQMLRGGSPAIAFAALSLYLASALHSMGKRYLLLGAMGAADLAFLVTVLVTPGAGILSLVYGGLVWAFLLCASLWAISRRVLKLRTDWIGMLAVPLAAGGISGLLCLLSGRLFGSFLGELATAAVTFLLCGAIYWILLLALRNLKEQELETLPGGRLLYTVCQRLLYDFSSVEKGEEK